MDEKDDPRDPDATLRLQNLPRPSSDSITQDGDTQTVQARRPVETPRDTQTGAYLVLVRGSAIGDTRLIGNNITIGRSRDADFSCPNDNGMSRIHARVSRGTQGNYLIDDLNSRNGTWVNDTRIAQHILDDGDTILVGSTILRFAYHDEVACQLRTAQRMQALGALAGGVSHDFNNLLAILSGGIEFLQAHCNEQSYPAEGKIQETLSDMATACRHAGRLTRQLLSCARNSAFQRKPVDLHQLSSQSIALVRRSCDYHIQIDTLLESDLFVLGDYAQLQQVVLNLLLNARDALPEGGKIVVGLKRRNNDSPNNNIIELTVQDNGCGMDEVTQMRIFEPFFTTKKSAASAGLGLSMVYSIVEKHGGQVTVESTVGHGSVFRITLPEADKVQQQRSVSPSEPTSPGKLAGKTILVVDDEKLVRRTIRRNLTRLHYRILEASCGQEALELYKQHQQDIDLILLDLVMPQMDGEETYKQLKKMNPDVQVIISSGYDAGRADSVLDLGAKDLLTKPWTASDFSQAVSKIFE